MNRSHRTALGLSAPVIVGLALLAAPRVVLQDLGVIHEGTSGDALFVFVPPAVWIAVAVLRRVPNPFLTLLALGAVYGVFLLLGHQLLWNLAWEGDPPSLGGNLSDLPPGLQEAVMRGFSAVGSLVTGTLVGTASGLVAWGTSKAARIRPRTPAE
ncbi:hypothetical protein [Nocardiopsis nanhaiensis]